MFLDNPNLSRMVIEDLEFNYWSTRGQIQKSNGLYALKVLSSEIDQAKSGLIRKLFINGRVELCITGRDPKIFSDFHPLPVL